MRDFDYSNTADRKARAYRTRATMAALYAEETDNPACAGAWAYIAQSLNVLADITERAGRDSSLPAWPKSRSALGPDIGSDIS